METAEKELERIRRIEMDAAEGFIQDLELMKQRMGRIIKALGRIDPDDNLGYALSRARTTAADLEAWIARAEMDPKIRWAFQAIEEEA